MYLICYILAVVSDRLAQIFCGSNATWNPASQALSLEIPNALSPPCRASDTSISKPSKTRKYVTNGPTAPFWAFPHKKYAPASASATAPVILAIASGTSRTCAHYDQYIPSVSDNANTCSYLAWFYGMKVEDFTKLNPSLSYNKDNPSDCVLKKGFRYCVREGHTSKSGTKNNNPPSSNSIVSTSSNPNLSTTALTSTLKPSPATPVASYPSEEIGGVSATPTFTSVQTGVVTQCKKWHMVEQGDGCLEIAKEYSIDIADFEKWNPAVKVDCTMLEIGFNVCVGV